MSDRDLRVLERRAAEGDEADAVALLAARLRAGRVSQERAIVAARLGDPIAQACFDFGRPLDWAKHADRVKALSGLDPRRAVALVCDWVRESLPSLVPWSADVGTETRSAVEAARAWASGAAWTVEMACAANLAWRHLHTGVGAAAAWIAHAAEQGAAGNLLGEYGLYVSACNAAMHVVEGAVEAAGGSGSFGASGDVYRDRQRLDVIRALLTPEDPS